MTAPQRIIFAGNPNVGKSTVFNALTGLKQHTGNWTGKTVKLASGTFCVHDRCYELWDLPGTYSIISNSPEEEVARDAICFQDAAYTVIVADATCLARNLNLVLQILEITPRAVLCVNLLDEAKRNSIRIDLDALCRRLSIPVIGITARDRTDIRRLKKFLAGIGDRDFPIPSTPPVRYCAPLEAAIEAMEQTLSHLTFDRFSRRFMAVKLLDNDLSAAKLMDYFDLTAEQRTIILNAAKAQQNALSAQGMPAVALRDEIVGALVETARNLTALCTHASTDSDAAVPSAADRLLTSRRFGIPIMVGFLGVLLWLTIYGANLPTQLLMNLFSNIKPYLESMLHALSLPPVLVGLFIDGVYQTTAWVTAVMLPPMLIFFPLFTLLEDLGFLPRLAFNLDGCFQSAGSCGRQALTMCMGLGCNAVGVTGCRIISSKRQRIAAMLTNCFIPCNGRFFMLITLSTLFIGNFFVRGMQSVFAALFLLLLILIGIVMTLLVTKLLTGCLKEKAAPPFSLELPPFRRPQLVKTLTRALLDRTLHVLSRAVRVSAPAGAIIWLMANIEIGGQNLLSHCALFFDPFARLLGLDGMILMAFLLALPANEIVLPILLMGYLSTGQMMDAASFQGLHTLLLENGWTVLTAINVMLFSLLHFPCATTLWTIQKESGSTGMMLLGFLIPTGVAMLTCMLTNGLWQLASIIF